MVDWRFPSRFPDFYSRFYYLIVVPKGGATTCNLSITHMIPSSACPLNLRILRNYEHHGFCKP